MNFIVLSSIGRLLASAQRIAAQKIQHQRRPSLPPSQVFDEAPAVAHGIGLRRGDATFGGAVWQRAFITSVWV
jgi:hypothetical protein